MKMTPKQNLIAVLSGGEPQWIPVCMHIANTNNLPGHLPQALLEEPLDRLHISEFVGGDMLHEVSAVRTKANTGWDIKTEARGDMRISTLTTTEGALTQEVMTAAVSTPVYDPLPEGHILPGPIMNSVHKAFFVKQLSDYRILKCYYETLTYECDNNLIAREQARVAEKGLCVLGGGPSSPLYALVSSHVGIERLSLDLFDDSEEVESTMQVMTDTACRWYRTAAASPCEVIRCTEDLDTKLVSPDWFRRYAVPALTKYARICHAAGKKFVIHMCGPVRDFLQDIKATGADAIHCLTAPPMGNTAIQEARRMLQGHMAVMLRVDAHLLLSGSVGEIDCAVANMCSELGDWNNVLAIIPCGRAPLENIRRVIDQFRKQNHRR